MDNKVTNTVDESLLNEFASLNTPEEEVEEEAISSPETQVVTETEEKPATVETEVVETTAVKEERANPRLLRKNNELTRQLEEANARIAKYES